MKITNLPNKHRVNHLSVDKTSAVSSYGEYFSIGELVEHEDNTAGQATILSFEIDEKRNEIRVNTDKGYAYLDFLVKIEKI